jgi:hypothetical protein
MTWKEAQEGTIRQWTDIRDSIGTADIVTLLTDINAVCDLCEKSDETKGATPFGRCDYCLFYQQFGGCSEVSARMSEMVAEGRFDEVRTLVDDMIAKTRLMKVPVERLPVVAA